MGNGWNIAGRNAAWFVPHSRPVRTLPESGASIAAARLFGFPVDSPLQLRALRVIRCVNVRPGILPAPSDFPFAEFIR